MSVSPDPSAVSASGAAPGEGAFDRSVPGAPTDGGGTASGENDPAAPRPQLPLSTQLTRFVLTGGLSAVVDYGLLVAGMAFGLGYSAAKAISWVFGTITAYAINSRWTFNSTGRKGAFAAVVVLYLTTFAVQVGTFTLIYPLFEAWWGSGVASFAGFVIAQGLATTVNFIVQRTFIFR
ncbi:MAG: GtrA family protein [Propioniciclava sp.]|uniref:GtrA family protein n=1 Tax=Propioniciclava sp. TaxID=2038686 RepID=UPI0039E35BEE